MDEDTLRSRVERWRRRAAEALDARERSASAELAEHYEALLARLLDGRNRPADGLQESAAASGGDGRRRRVVVS
ncbi:hypothetical protein [Brevundimonas sp. LjRoot202]|uniref:hypothetical protein n=1 Tax=Brevundimonas sp. LjRoot202 TaxID=3342281 RepID=UPI003ECCAFCD